MVLFGDLPFGNWAADFNGIALTVFAVFAGGDTCLFVNGTLAVTVVLPEDFFGFGLGLLAVMGGAGRLPVGLAGVLAGSFAGDFPGDFADEAGMAFAKTGFVLDLTADTAAFFGARVVGLPLTLPAIDALFLLVTI